MTSLQMNSKITILIIWPVTQLNKESILLCSLVTWGKNNMKAILSVEQSTLSITILRKANKDKRNSQSFWTLILLF